MAKKVTWWQAAEIIGVTMRRWRERIEEHGYSGLSDGRKENRARQVIEKQGLFCALCSDRGSHFFVTLKAGEKVDKQRLS